MKTFDINTIPTFPLSEREKNVFYKADEFKMRVIELAENQELPECEMKSYVIFFLVKGKVQTTINNEKSVLKEGKLLVSEPAIFSMKAIENSRLIGIQINIQN
ncbi:MAG: hypothetical protein EOL95_10275 [Bacteroidia bacterium]|jgi:quercetin dioxygenase-like cupin family protein|nr:hypothetical protein [Bacteroidia bacterium]